MAIGHGASAALSGGFGAGNALVGGVVNQCHTVHPETTMKSKSSIVFFSVLAVICAMLFATSVQAADSPDRLEGRVHMISSDKTTLTLHVTTTPGTQAMSRYVALTGKTEYTFQNEAGTFDQIKEGLRVICVGKFDENGKLLADRVDVRKRQ